MCAGVAGIAKGPTLSRVMLRASLTYLPYVLYPDITMPLDSALWYLYLAKYEVHNSRWIC
jgi:hypothetical protein